jgi:hypothetical protein
MFFNVNDDLPWPLRGSLDFLLCASLTKLRAARLYGRDEAGGRSTNSRLPISLRISCLANLTAPADQLIVGIRLLLKRCLQTIDHLIISFLLIVSPCRSSVFLTTLVATMIAQLLPSIVLKYSWATLFCLLVIVNIVWRIHEHFKKSVNVPSVGYGAFPYVGSWLGALRFSLDPRKYILLGWRQYGNGIFKISTIQREHVVVCDKGLIQEFLSALDDKARRSTNRTIPPTKNR